MGVEMAQGKGHFLRIVWPTEKQWKSLLSARLYAAKGIIQSSITALHAMRPFVKKLL